LSLDGIPRPNLDVVSLHEQGKIVRLDLAVLNESDRSMRHLGVDVSKDSLDVAVEGQKGKRGYERKVSNDLSGFKRLLSWAKERTGAEPEGLIVVMEATGVYHEAAALALHEAGCRVFVANPKRVRDYASGLGLLNKTDRVDARALLRYGREKAPELVAWQPPAIEVRTLRALYARLSAVTVDLRRELNRQEQAQLSGQPEAVQQSMRQSIEHLQQDRERLMKAIEDHFNQHPDLKNQRELLQSMPGIGPVSADRMLCLLLRHRFVNARQAAAFAGLVPRRHESGTSVRKRPRLTRQGDPSLKAALYMAAVVACRHNAQLRAHYQGLLKAGKSKMSALGALMRRMLHIAFGILKHQTPYDPQLALSHH
jgi:transposase